MIANVCMCAFHLSQSWILKKRKCAFKSIPDPYKTWREQTHSLARCCPSFQVWRCFSEKSVGWSACELGWHPAHTAFRRDVSSALTSRGRGLSLQPPLSTLISSAYSALLSNFLLKACLPGNINHSDRFFFLGLCNTLIYTLSLFSHGLLCVKDALYFYPKKDLIHILGLKSSCPL